MRTVVALMVACGVVLAGCGGSEAKKAGTVVAVPEALSATPAANATIPANFDHSRVLLALEDMPTGWAKSAGVPKRSAGGTVCKATPLMQESVIGGGVTEFERGLFEQVESEVFTYAPGKAQAALDLMSYQIERCTEPWTLVSTGGESTTARLSLLSFPKLGDQSTALRYIIEGTSGLVVLIESVSVRRGDAIIQVRHIVSAQRMVPAIDSMFTERMIRRTDERLQAALAAR